MVSEPYTERAIAEHALSMYEIEPSVVEFLQHSGTITYRIKDIHGSYFLLRVYLPISTFFTTHWTCPDHVRSEMMWLSYLNEEGSVSVQEPLKTKENELICLLDIKSRKQVPGTLLRWIEGENKERLDKEQVEQIAMLLARLHQLWAEWSVPPGFARPCYDTKYLREALAEAEKHVGHKVIAAPEFRLFEESVEIICSLMNELGESADYWGLIHGDFFHPNIVFRNSKASPIDFSECGDSRCLLV